MRIWNHKKNVENKEVCCYKLFILILDLVPELDYKEGQELSSKDTCPRLVPLRFVSVRNLNVKKSLRIDLFETFEFEPSQISF